MYTNLLRTITRLTLNRTYSTLPGRRDGDAQLQSALDNANNTPSLNNFFVKSSIVLNKRKFNRERGQLHFIFLEGPPGTGKQGVLWRLNKVRLRNILNFLPKKNQR